MQCSHSFRRQLIAALALVPLCVACAAQPPAAAPQLEPSPSAEAIVTATPSQAFQASVVAAVQATSSAIALALTPTAPAFADLAPFRHQPTGLIGLMPAGWQLADAADGFVIRPGPDRQGSFTVTLTDTSKLPAGEPERLTRALFDRLRQPGLFITEDHLAPDGTGRLTLIGDPGLTTYAWAKQTDRGLLTMIMIVPTAQREWESQSIERMLESVELAGDTLSSVGCRHSFTQHPVTAEDDWFVPQEQRGDLFDPTIWYDGPVGFFGSSIADFNGDGRQDLALASNSSPDEPSQLYILLQSSDGTLGEPTCFSIAGLPKTMATGDLNGDGRADVVLGGMDPKIDLYLSADQGLFGARRSLATESDDILLVTVADLNSDGRDDVAVFHADEQMLSLLLQQADGTLAAGTLYANLSTSSSVEATTVGDLNGDGRPDIIVAGRGGLTLLYGRAP